MRWEELRIDCPAAERVSGVTVSEWWDQSGGRRLTAPDVAVPEQLVRRLAGLAALLDDGGAGLAARFGAAGVGVLGMRRGSLHLEPSSRANPSGSARLLSAGDGGWLAVSLARPDDVSSIPAWLGIDPGDDNPWPAVTHALTDRSAAEIADRAILLGLPCARVGEVTDARAVLAAPLGDAPARPLAGTTVVTLASLWAGPLAAYVLAELGARVITVESFERPDGARSTPAFFDALHARSEFVSIAFGDAAGRRQLFDLLRSADVVIEGSRPRALAQLGLDAERCVREGPQVWLSITAYGRSAPHDARVGFGDDTAAGGGLLGWSPSGPTFLADAVADPLAGLTAAASAVELLKTGGRYVVDVALARCAAAAAKPAGPDPSRNAP